AGERIYTMLPFDEGRTLVGTRTQGLFLYDGSRFEPFETEADAQLLGRQLYMPGTVIPGGFLLNTLNGALIVGRDGRLVRVLDETNGLTGRAVISVFADEARPDVQWLALDQGIARVEATGPFSMFDAAHGLQGAVDDVVRHAGQLYAATSSSMLVLADGGFQEVDLPAPEIHRLLSTETALLVATDEGVFGVENNRSEPVRASVNKDFEAFALHQFRGYPAHVGVGHRYGITVLERTETGWRDLGRVPDLTADVTSLAETADGTLWAGTLATGVVRLHQTSDTLEPAGLVSEAFAPEQGLPEGGARVEVIGDVVHAVTAEGIYHFDPEANQFERTLKFEEAVAAGRASVAADEAGRLWSFGRGLALQGANAPETPNPFGRFSDLLVNTVFADEDGTTWFGTGAGLLRYDPSAEQSYEAEFSALIRLVEIGEDSLVYAGAGAVAPPTLEYRDNSFHIRYAASSYEAPEQLRYQYQLEGFDDGWSGWTPATLKEYTNVPEGDYVFRVRARNAYGKLSTEAAYSLTIRPPWHRTWWAYLGYALGGLALLAGIGQIQTRRLQRREREKAAQREAELQLKNELEIKEIEAASLRELDEMRTALFANITHEFRTPLTLILGHIDLLKRDLQPGPATEKLDVARRNAGQLQHLINQLLDVARLEAGKMPLRAQPADLIPFLRRLFFAFESMAEPRSIALEFDAVPEQVEVYFEPEKLEKVFANLVSNAVKFTPDAGRVSMRVRQASEHSDRVEIAVRDTGIGIPEAHLPHVFDRFYQAEQGPTRAYEGTGIGLALVKELTELHHGEVQVQSEAGVGTVFTVVLPLGAGHLKPDEIDQKATATTGPTTEPTAESMTAPAPSGDVLPASVAVEEAEGRRVVLVVEDNADMRQFIAELLAPEYEVLEAPNGKAGFATARDHIPDLIVSDVMMPILDGYALAEHLRADELTSHIPIVMLTAKAAEEERLQGLEAGVDAYLAKPFSARELQVRVRKLIELRDQLRASYSESGPAVLQATRVHVSSMDQQFLDRLKET
ncbi:MAG: ATP-binding protein, partial [Bacteroidota bacterium]